jgi:hypothetical protein
MRTGCWGEYLIQRDTIGVIKPWMMELARQVARKADEKRIESFGRKT